MNKEHPLTQVRKILDTRRQVPSGQYLLYTCSKKISLCKEGLQPGGSRTIATLNSLNINEGLSARTWQQIEDRIRIHRKEGLL